MEAKMSDLRKGEVIMLPFVVTNACNPQGVIHLAVNSRSLGDGSEAAIKMQSPDLLVQLCDDLIITGDIVTWPSYAKQSQGWGRVEGEHKKWIIVKAWDAPDDFAPLFILKENAKRDPKLTMERDELWAKMEKDKKVE